VLQNALARFPPPADWDAHGGDPASTVGIGPSWLEARRNLVSRVCQWFGHQTTRFLLIRFIRACEKWGSSRSCGLRSTADCFP